MTSMPMKSNGKIKVVYKGDIRIFRHESSLSFEDILTQLREFVTKTFEVTFFSLSFKDEEGDMVTVVDVEDLKEAVESSQGSSTAKIYVNKEQEEISPDEDEDDDVIISSGKVTKEGGIDTILDDVLNEYVMNGENEQKLDEEAPKEEEQEEKPVVSWCQFMDDLSSNSDLKDEFVNFLATFVIQLREEKFSNMDPKTCFITALSIHENVSKHPVMQRFVSEKLEILMSQFHHLVPFLLNVPTENIGHYVNTALEVYKNKKQFCHGRRGGKRGRRGRGRHGPPRMPPFLFPLMHLFREENDEQVAPPPHHPFHPMMGMFGRPPHHGHGRRRGGGRRCGRGRRGPQHGPHGRRHHGHGHGPRPDPRGPPPFAFGPFEIDVHRDEPQQQCPGQQQNQDDVVLDLRMTPNGEIISCNSRGGSGRGGRRRCRGRKRRDGLRADIIEENVTFANKAIVLGNQSLIKTWKMKNVGSVDIPAGSKAQYIGKRFNPMVDGTSFVVNNDPIKPEEEFEVSVMVKSPQYNGEYFSRWRLMTPDGNKFGQRLVIEFTVANGKSVSNSSGDENRIDELIHEMYQQDLVEQEVLEASKKEEEPIKSKKEVKEEKKLLKKQQKIEKKQQKIEKKQEKIEKKTEKLAKKEESLDVRRERIRRQREELLWKLEQLEKQSSSDVADEKDDAPVVAIKDDSSDDMVIVEPEDDNDNEGQQPQVAEKEAEVEIYDEHDNIVSSSVDVPEEEAPEVEPEFEYSAALSQLTSMGFDAELVKELLIEHSGSIDAVINRLFN